MKILILLLGSFLAALISSFAGFGGSLLLLPSSFLRSLNLAPVAYIASEAATATAMHILKIVIYSKLTDIDLKSVYIGLAMGAFMFLGTYISKMFLKKIEKNKFQKYVAVLLMVVGIYMVAFGA